MKDFFSRIRSLAFKQMPYMASLIYYIKPVENNSIPIAAITNNGVFYYNKKYLDFEDQDATFVMLHETLHLLSDYFGRIGTKNPKMWNIASDMYINDILESSGIITQLPLIFPRKHNLPRFKSADFYYEKITNDPNFSMNYKYSSFSIINKFNEEIKKFNEDGDTIFEDQNNKEGEGEKTLIEDLESAIRSCGIAIKKYTDQGGNVSSELIIDVNKIFDPPEVNWKRIFRLKTRKAKESICNGKSDYSYVKHSRRESDVVFPGLIDRQTSLGVLLDTSGSMSKDLIEKCLGQIRHIKKFFSSVWFVSIDTKIQTSFQLRNINDLYKYGKIKGGGGTILVDGFKELQNRNIGVCVAISDLCADVGEKPPFPVIWMSERNRHAKAPWGTIIEVF